MFKLMGKKNIYSYKLKNFVYLNLCNGYNEVYYKGTVMYLLFLKNGFQSVHASLTVDIHLNIHWCYKPC